VLSDEDVQLSLWVLYEQHYRGFDDVDPGLEWSPALLQVRAQLETLFEPALRELASPAVARAMEGHEPGHDRVVEELNQVIEDVDGPSLAAYIQRKATDEQFREFMTHRSVYHLKESDPHAFAVPRLTGRAKVALAELQYDEFGGGVPERLHSALFARSLEAAGLLPEYGAYVDAVPATTLAVNNAMSLFGLHRRLRGACMGHLAAFEATSSLPCRRYSGGAARLGHDERVTDYFDEHIEADAVHELLALRDICQRLVDDEPRLHEDVLFGAATCVRLEAIAGARMIEAWESGGSSLLAEARQEIA
jgi:hypothetical protein